MDDFTKNLNDLGTVSRSAAILSLLGAAFILQDILKDGTRRKNIKNRIILGMSLCDFVFCLFGPILGLWMVPSDSFPGAHGSQLTCNIQGFVASAAVGGSSTYNAALAILYLLMGFNFGGYMCVSIPAPLGCVPGVNCVRGESTLIWNTAIFVFVLMKTVIIMSCMYLLYQAVLARERAGDRFRFMARERGSRRGLSNVMKAQGIWYSAAYCLFALPYCTLELIERSKPGSTSFWFLGVQTFTLNIVGFFNAIIYVRPRFLKFRGEHPDQNAVKCVIYTMLRTAPPSATESQQHGTSARINSRPLNKDTTRDEVDKGEMLVDDSGVEDGTAMVATVETNPAYDSIDANNPACKVSFLSV